MRIKTKDFLAVLNRARPEVKTEKKTITYVDLFMQKMVFFRGRTFIQQ
jgi:hypothetical protein